jgi:F0F1-type ATP synthase epsilon subunit
MNSDAFELEIVEKTKSKKLSVFWIEVQSPTGDFVVGPDHSPLISTLKHKGKLTYKEFNNVEKSIDIYGGIFKVSNNRATVLLD